MIEDDLCLHKGINYRGFEYTIRNVLQQVKSERMQTLC